MSSAAGIDDHSRTPRFVSALIACYSRHFRARFGTELAGVIDELWTESRGASPIARAFLAVRLAADLVVGVLADRLGSLMPPRKPGRGIRRTRPPLPSFIDSALVDTPLPCGHSGSTARSR